MSTKLRRGRSRVAVLAVVAMVAGLLALPLSAGAATAACPDTIPSAGFTDMASYSTAAQDAVDCIAFYGVTAGVGGTLYGPDLNVPRWQMAIFLWKVLLAAGETVDTTDFGFTDIAGESATAQGAINAIANAGISVGKGGGLFAPDDNVTRTEMAFFLAATLKELGVTLDTTAFGFTDIGTLSAAAQDAINAIANAGVSAGVGGGLYGPADLTTRVQMALFLAAELDEAGVIPPVEGTKGIVTAFADPNLTYDNATTGVSAVLVVDNETTDTFLVDGAAASRTFFVSQVTAGDEIVFNKVDTDADYDTFALTNVPTAESGLVGAVDTTGTSEFSIVTIGNTVLNTFIEGVDYSAAGTAFSVDGASSTLTAFLADISHGDTVALTDTSSPKDGFYETIALTNGSASGAVKNITKGDVNLVADAIDDVTFTINGELGDYPIDDAAYTSDTLFVGLSTAGTAQVYTIDGVNSTQAQFVAAVTDGDSVVYSRAAGKETFALTNGTVDLSFTGLTIEGAATSAVVGNTLHVLVDGLADTFDMTVATTIKVDGVTVALSEVKALIDAGLPVGDSASYVGATKVLTLTNATSTPELSIANVVVTDDGNLGNDNFDLLAGTVTILNNLPANFGTPNTKYFVNGTEVTGSVYVDYLVEIAADTNTTGDSFQAVISGGFVQHRLTTTEVLP